MNLPQWNNVQFSYKPMIIQPGDGINTFLPPLEIGENEWSYGRNVSSRKYPAAATRPGKQKVFLTVTTPNILGQRNNQYPHVLDNTTWKRWDGAAYQTVQTGLTSATGKFVDFKTGTTLYTILANGTDRYSWDGTTAASLTAMPATPFVTAFKGRLYAASGKTLYFSALNKITDWTTVNDAGQIDITNAKGDATALTMYGNHVIAWTEFSMYELYGTGPSSYKLSDVEDAKGCISDGAAIELDGVLYFLHYDGVYAYSGGAPVKVSHQVDYYINLITKSVKNKCVSWWYDHRVFFSIPYNGATANNLTLEYDTHWKKWYVHDYGVVDTVNIGDYAYGIDSTGQIWDMENGTDDGGTAIAWEFITKVSTELYMRGKRLPIGHLSSKKVLSNLWLQYDLPVGSTMHVWLSATESDSDFVEVIPMNESGVQTPITASAELQTQRIIMPISLLAQNIDVYRLRFTGTGPMTLYTIEKDIRVKTK